jgi:cytochrome c peroxidase
MLAVVTAIVFSAFRGEEKGALPVPKGWPKPAYDFDKNPMTPVKVALGRKLFFDPILSKDATISCASCHLPQTAFAHTDHDLSHGIADRIGKRNSPVLMNLAWSNSFMWDGSVHHLDVQALAPISAHDEMDETMEGVVRKLGAAPEYPALFAAAFGSAEPTGEHTLKAISTFLCTLVSSDSKYDKVQRGEAVFNEWETHGYALFKTHCASCHREPLFTNGSFENNGLPVDTTLNDVGRMKISGQESDRQKFKVPTLRNVEVSYPYMHDGRFKNLAMVVFHYTEGIHQSSTLSPHLRKGIRLAEDEKRDLVLFLKTLTDETFLTNPAFQPTTSARNTP